MLRRKSPDLVEFRALELALSRIAPAHLSDERRLVLFERVMASLPAQEPTTADRVRALAQARWVAIPVGAGVAAAIIAGTTIWAAYLDHDDGEVTLQKPRFKGPSGYVEEGQLVRVSESTWFNYGEDVRLGLEAGGEAVFASRENAVNVSLRSGAISLVSTGTPIYLNGSNWSAVVGAHAGARFELLSAVLRVEPAAGTIALRVNGVEINLDADDGATDLSLAVQPDAPGGDGAPFVGDPGTPVFGASGGHGAPPTDPPQVGGNANGDETAPGQTPPHEAPPSEPGNSQGTPPSNPGNGSADPNPPTGPGTNNGQGTPPSDPGNGNGSPPANPGSGNANGSPPAEPGTGNGNGSPPAQPGNGSPPADPGNGSGNGTPPADPGNGSGNGTPPAEPGNGNGNGSPPADPGSGNGGGTPPEDPGNGNGSANGNSPADPGQDAQTAVPGEGAANTGPEDGPANANGVANRSPNASGGTDKGNGNGNAGQKANVRSGSA